MTANTFKINGLERGEIVTIYNSTKKGEIAVKGQVTHAAPPWVVYLVTIKNDEFWTEDPFPFLGPYSGIKKIEKDDFVLYEKNTLTVPYPTFDVYTHKGQIELNTLRKICFGSGFGYVFQTENYIVRDRKERRKKEVDDMFESMMELHEKFEKVDRADLMRIVRSQKGKGYLTTKEANDIKHRIKMAL